MTNESGLAAAILAGGLARRLGGVNKGTLAVGDVPIVDRQLDVLRKVASTVFVVGRDAPAWSARGLAVVADAVPGAGALGGIYTAIVRSPCARTLVVACDLPFLSAAFLRRLDAETDADLVIPRSRRGYEPLCAIYSRACASEMHARLIRGDLQASVLPRGVRVVEIGPEIMDAYDPDGLLFVNVNTPHDYERAKGAVTVMQGQSEDRITTDPPTDVPAARSRR
jgi:molybdopterin-guanine dinucleotide biosynthesis protein A